MENTQPMKTRSESGSPAVISDGSIKSGLVADTGKGASTSLSAATSATMRSASSKTWKSAELAELRLKAGLVAGALAEFQAAGGLVAVKNVEYEPGKYSVKIILVAEGLNITKIQTADGLDFEILPLPSGIVAEKK
jgi:hypothetical protein